MHYPLQIARTSVTTLVLLLLEGEVLKRTQLFDSVAGIVDDSGRTIADQMVDQIQSLEYEKEKKILTLKICFQYLGWTARVFQIASVITL